MSAKNKKKQPEGVSSRVLVVAMVVAFLFGVYVGGVGFSLYQDQGGDAGQSQMRMPAGMPPQGQGQSQDKASSEDQAAIRRLEAQVKDKPNDLGAWIHLGNHYFDSNQFKGAIRAYTRALELEPGNADVLTDLGVMYRRDNNPQKAIECFDKAVAANPTHRTARFNKGIVYLHDLNDMPHALETWEALLQQNPQATTPDGRSLKNLVDELRKQQQ